MSDTHTPAPTAAIRTLAGLVSTSELYRVKAAQQATLRKLKLTLRMLEESGRKAEQALQDAKDDLDTYRKLVSAIRQELDHVHGQIRALSLGLAHVS